MIYSLSSFIRFTIALSHLLLLFLLLPSVVISSESAKLTQKIEHGKYKPWQGDFNQMVERRFIRVLMPYSKTFYFFDGATPRGLNYDLVKKFEADINEKLQTKHLKIHTVIIPAARDQLLDKLKTGIGDIVVANLTITDKRQQLVDFTDPHLTNIDEILITAANGPKIQQLSDLSGKEIHVRKSSSYFESLQTLNKKFADSAKPLIKIVPADENLEDEDLLEMVNTGLIPMIIIDSHKGLFWGKIFKNIRLFSNIKVNSGGQIAWAIRKNSPQLKEVINSFVKKTKKGTLKGNILFNRYLKNTAYIENSHNKKDMKRFRDTINYFKKYGNQYDFDHLMLTALAYQESRLDQNAKSRVGAIGVMQILPTTAQDKNINISDIHQVESNIHAGTKYLRFIRDRYFSKGSSMDARNRVLFSFAAYNAGPAKVSKLRAEAKKMGYNPNIWFKNVEVIAAKRIGRETVQYVSNIYKYYIGYKLLAHKMDFDKKSE